MILGRDNETFQHGIQYMNSWIKDNKDQFVDFERKMTSKKDI